MVGAQLSVLLVDDRCSMRRGLRMRLQLEPDLTVVGEASNAADGAVLARQLEADVVLLAMPNLDDLSLARSLVAGAPRSLVYILTARATRARSMAVRAIGVVGLVSIHDGPDALIDIVRGGP